jgi:hypothetical protein
MANQEIVWYNATSKSIEEIKNPKPFNLNYLMDCALKKKSTAHLCRTGPKAMCGIFKANATKLVGGTEIVNFTFYTELRAVSDITKVYRKCVKDVVESKQTIFKSLASRISSADSSNKTLYKVLQTIDTIINDIILPVMSKYLKGSFNLLIRLPQQLNNLPTPIKFTMFSVYLYIKRERILNIIKQSKDIFNPKGIDINQNEEYLTSSDI